MIRIQPRTSDHLHILDLEGRLRAHSEYTFWEAVQKAVVHDHARQLILNFSEVTQIDSYGISELLRVQKSIHNLGGKLVLVGVQGLVAKVLRITRVEDLLDIQPDEATAILHLKAISPASAPLTP